MAQLFAKAGYRTGLPEIEQNKANPFYLPVELNRQLDTNVGSILQKLENLQLAEDTIVVFTAIGQQPGSHREESASVPLLLRYPRLLKPGVQDDLLFSGVDILPTLLGFCGIDAPDGVQGREHSKFLSTGEGDRPDSIYCQGQLGTPAEWRMLVRGLDKMVIGRDMQVTHLYNLGSDPMEQDNLAKNNAYVRLRDALMARLKRWAVVTGDRIPYPMDRRR